MQDLLGNIIAGIGNCQRKISACACGMYTYRNIRPDGVDADYATRVGEDGAWTMVWSGHYDRIGPAEK